MKRATVPLGVTPKIFSNFNPRPREEGDTSTGVVRQYIKISIHALVKRATKKLVGDLDYKIISIHALVKRATILY